MFQSLFNSLSGLFSFSRSLDTVSNNVSNMNTPGFRGSDSFFENLIGGRGSRIAGEGLRTSQGDIRQTGNNSDLAIEGAGFFVLRDAEGNLHYTRAGQFRFDEEGRLVDTVTRHQVMAIDASGALSPITIENARTLPAVATTRVDLAGNLASTATTHTIPSIRVFDAQGNPQVLNVVFTNNGAVTPNSWLVSIRNEAGAVVGSGELRFGADGSLVAGFSSVTATITALGQPQAITFDFGTPGVLSGSTQFPGIPTSLGARQVDGNAVLGLSNLSFDARGVLKLTYSNGETRDGQQIALAFLSNESDLKADGGRLFSGINVQGRQLGRAQEGAFGRIAGSSLEMSNIDLTQEFADMIIIQRGYQASSRVMSVTNEMIENLYNSTRGG